MTKTLLSEPRWRSRRRFTETERAAHLTSWGRSGLSARVYAREHGMTGKSLYVWRRRARLKEGSASKPEESTFIPVRVNSAQPSGAGSMTITLRCMGGLEIEVGGTSSARDLVSVVQSLKKEVFDV